MEGFLLPPAVSVKNSRGWVIEMKNLSLSPNLNLSPLPGSFY
jgi:hypothetical protein